VVDGGVIEVVLISDSQQLHPKRAKLGFHTKHLIGSGLTECGYHSKALIWFYILDFLNWQCSSLDGPQVGGRSGANYINMYKIYIFKANSMCAIFYHCSCVYFKTLFGPLLSAFAANTL